MTQPRLDVVAIGNAIVDVIASADDTFLAAEGLTKGGMQLIDADHAEALYGKMGPGREISGGSAANTLAGLAALGRKCAFVGQVADDQLGQVFAHDIRAVGVDFDVAPRTGEPPTARCLILVTPDGERTMNTFLGAAHYLHEGAMDEDLIASARYLYLEGYMWDPPEPRRAMLRAIEVARAAGREVAFTVSVNFIIEKHRADIRGMIDRGLIDILFCNEEEAQCLMEMDGFEESVAALAAKVPVLVATRSEKGAIAIENGTRAEIAAEPVDRVVDTTGAGDLFAAGFLAGRAEGRDLQACLRIGAIAAAEVISHYGARPEADLKQLVAAKLG